MRAVLWAGAIGGMMAASCAWAAVSSPTMQHSADAQCGAAAVAQALGAVPCVEGDVVQLAAQLLVVKFGSGATAFAAERAGRYAQEDDPGSAGFWRQIGEAAAELLKSR